MSAHVTTPPAIADRFTRTFREEHREIRDALLDLVDSLRQRDHGRAQALLGRIAILTGPHFRYEEEAMYPALTSIFGPEYIEKLLEDHDGAIRTARRLVELTERPLTEADSVEAVRLARTILPHVSDCDGLSIMVERFPPERIAHILQTRTDALAADVDLLTWARTIRQRAV